MLVHIDGRVTVTCDRCHGRFRLRFRPEDAPGTMSDEELALERGWQRTLDGFRQAHAVDKDTGRAMIQVAQPGHLCARCGQSPSPVVAHRSEAQV